MCDVINGLTLTLDVWSEQLEWYPLEIRRILDVRCRREQAEEHQIEFLFLSSQVFGKTNWEMIDKDLIGADLVS